MSPGSQKSTQIELPVTPLRMHDGQPILTPVLNHDWESRVVLNPAAVLIERGEELDTLFDLWRLVTRQRLQLNNAGGACVLIYRARGESIPQGEKTPSFLGLAILTPDLVLVHRFQHPVLKPDLPWHNLGVEDPRCTKIGDTFYLYYTGYARRGAGSGDGPESIQICLSTTRDFLTWEHRGPAAGDINFVANKNAALFPDSVNKSWLLLHRPMTGHNAMTIHSATADDPAGPWKSQGILMKGLEYPDMKQSWIGAGGPPVPTGDGRFVVIYHLGHYLVDGSRLYTLGVALLDFRSDQGPVRSRIEPLMIPTGPEEQIGDTELGVNNVLFTCGNYIWNNDLIIPYAAADSRIFGARINFIQLIKALDNKTDN